MFLQHVLEILFPRRCVGCKTFGSFLCENCFTSLSFHEAFVCPSCLKPSIAGFIHPGCKTLHALDGLLSGYTYQGVIKRLLYQFKYKPYLSSLSETLGELLVENLSQSETFYSLLKNKPLILPIPLYFRKEKIRGYNHAALLAFYVAQYFTLEYRKDILFRSKNTKPQFKLSKDKRFENLKNAFSLHDKKKEEIRGKTIILIDDLATTCSTLRECARVLKRSGATAVWGVTLAKEL